MTATGVRAKVSDREPMKIFLRILDRLEEILIASLMAGAPQAEHGFFTVPKVIE